MWCKNVEKFVFVSYTFVKRKKNSHLTLVKKIFNSDGSGSKFFVPGWVVSFFCCSGWVGLGQTPLNVENFPQISQFFSLWVKNTLVKGSSALYLRSGWVMDHLYLLMMSSHVLDS